MRLKKYDNEIIKTKVQRFIINKLLIVGVSKIFKLFCIKFANGNKNREPINIIFFKLFCIYIKNIK